MSRSHALRGLAADDAITHLAEDHADDCASVREMLRNELLAALRSAEMLESRGAVVAEYAPGMFHESSDLVSALQDFLTADWGRRCWEHDFERNEEDNAP